jgi:hypothetical protein
MVHRFGTPFILSILSQVIFKVQHQTDVLILAVTEFANSDLCVLIPKCMAICELEDVSRISTLDTNAKTTTSGCTEHVKFGVEAGQKTSLFTTVWSAEPRQGRQ